LGREPYGESWAIRRRGSFAARLYYLRKFESFDSCRLAVVADPERFAAAAALLRGCIT